jgi:hypothetical protein
MRLGGRFADVDLRVMAPALFAAALTFVALFFLIDRLQRIAQAKPIFGDDRLWKAMTGTELRLSGLDEGPLVGVETSPGGGLTVRSPRATLQNGGPARQLTWLNPDENGGDNKAKVEVSLIGKGGSVRLSRAGEAVAPQLLIRAENAKLRVDSGVTIGNSLAVPPIEIFFDGKPLPVTGMGFSFIVPEGGSVAIEFPALPNGTPSGVVTSLGAVREEQEDTVLPVREVGVFREGASSPDKAMCASNQTYAWALFVRPALFPLPHGTDCRPGAMTGRDFSIGPDFVAVALAGQAWRIEAGRPSASLWSWAENSPLLSIVIRWGLPAAVAWILGLITWRRTAPTPEAPQPKKVTRSRGRRGREPS